VDKRYIMGHTVTHHSLHNKMFLFIFFWGGGGALQGQKKVDMEGQGDEWDWSA
jgi:hypothetical protein